MAGLAEYAVAMAMLCVASCWGQGTSHVIDLTQEVNFDIPAFTGNPSDLNLSSLVTSLVANSTFETNQHSIPEHLSAHVRAHAHLHLTRSHAASLIGPGAVTDLARQASRDPDHQVAGPLQHETLLPADIPLAENVSTLLPPAGSSVSLPARKLGEKLREGGGREEASDVETPSSAGNWLYYSYVIAFIVINVCVAL